MEVKQRHKGQIILHLYIDKMTKNIIYLLILIISFPNKSFSQNTDNIFERLQAIKNRTVTFYNIDGQEITSQEIDAEFNAKNISKGFKKLKIREKELTSSDSSFEFPNFFITKSKKEADGSQNFMSYYFIESKNKGIIGFTFVTINKPDKTFERVFIRLVRNNEIPDSVFNTTTLDTIHFAGRKIFLGSNCHWMGVNNVQCTYFGQMNWSVHKTLIGAEESVKNQFEVIKRRKGGKVITDTTVSVLFEGERTIAIRVVYDFTGVRSLLVGMTGGKTLTIYFVAVPVRNNFVSCVMSFWNNDQINPGGLPPLLEKVMSLE